MAEASLDPQTDTELIAACRQTLPDLDDRQVERLIGFRDAMFETNQRVNLTAIRDRSEIGRRLVLESLRLVPSLDRAIGLDSQPEVLDLGTGGGIPGLILAIARPDIPFVLLDATGKKLTAVSAIAKTLGVANISTLHSRAEDAAHDPAWRTRFTVVTARAVSSISALLELGLPFLKLQGTLILPKGPDIEKELRDAATAATILGGNIATSELLPHNGSHTETTLVIVEKRRATPSAYPRRSGLPSKQPLGSGTPAAKVPEAGN